MIVINGQKFEPISGCSYKWDYGVLASKIASKEWPERDALRQWILDDLFFIVYFVLKIPIANHPFVVKACRDVELGAKDYTLDVWAREHFKSTIITIAETIQFCLREPNEAAGIFSYVRPVAKKFLFSIKETFQNERILHHCFPDVVWANCEKDAPLWSLDEGLILKRTTNRKEPNISAWGLVEGMPTGFHFKRRVYDDISTEDMAESPDMMEKVKTKFDSSQNLGTDDGHHRVIGTYYHHADPLTYIRGIKTPDGNPRYEYRFRPGSDDGTANGKPVYVSQKRWDDLKLTRTFNCHAAGTKILLPDFTEKNIQDLTIGEKIVGFKNSRTKTRLEITAVEKLFVRQAEAGKYIFASGRSTVCTPDHRWWTGRWNSVSEKRQEYATLEDRGGNGKRKPGLIRMFSGIPDVPNDPEIIKACAYLGGIYDGEGSVSANTLRIFQSESHNPGVCEKIRRCMKVAGFRHRESKIGRKVCTEWRLLGGRSETLKFAKWCEISKWLDRIYSFSLLANKNGSSKHPDNLVSSKSVGEIPVYGIQTGAGNYIANGYGSKNCQQLLDPSPIADQKLNPDLFTPIERRLIPKEVYRFMLVDQAGDLDSNIRQRGMDSWAVGVIAVEPFSDDLGQSRIFYEDLWITPASESEAIDQIVRMYLKAGMIMKLGVEKVGISTTHLHISNALKAYGRFISWEKGGNGVLLRPAGRNKKKMIESALAWPLNNGKMFYSTACPTNYVDRIKMEMRNFPVWHDDGINMGAYLYDVLKDYYFGMAEEQTELEKKRRYEPKVMSRSWMSV